MDSNSHSNGAEQKSGPEGVKKLDPQPSIIKKKPRVRKLIFRGTAFVICFGLAQFFNSPGHKFFCLTTAFVFGYLTLQLELQNHEETKSRATKYSVGLFFVAELVVVFVCFLQPKTSLPIPEPAPPNTNSRSFSIVCKTSISGTTAGAAFAALYTIRGPKTVVSAISQLMFVQLTNLKGQPLMIDSYSLEAEISPGNWILVPAISPNGTQFFMTFDLTKCSPVDVSSSAFDYAIAGESIEPYHSVQGWIFASIPKDGFIGPWRMRIIDATRQQYVQTIEKPTNAEQDEIQKPTFKIPGWPAVDLSAYPWVPLLGKP